MRPARKVATKLGKIGTVASLLALALLAPAGPAFAQKPAARPGRAATVHAEKGQRYYDLQRYDDAIREFEAAYEAGGDASVLYNLAQSHRLAGHTADAIRFYELYLNRVPDAP